MSSAFFPNTGPGVPPVAGQDTFTSRMAATEIERPLEPAQRAALDDALRMLHHNLRGLLAALPVEVQTASGLARSLQVERTTCQRAVSAANQPFTGAALVGQLPGIAGLRALADAAARRWADAPDVLEATRSLRGAIDGYAAVLHRTAGSRARLLVRLSAAVPECSPPAALQGAQARQLFEAASALTGRRSQTWLSVHIFEPGVRPDRLFQTRAYGLIGHTARADAVPLTFHVFATPSADAERADDAAELGRFHALLPGESGDGVPAEVLRAFSSDPPPVVRTRQPNEFLVQAVEPSAGSSRASDLVFGLRGLMAHPGRTPPFMEEVWALINFPARWLLLDVFLHRDVARRCIPALDVHLWRPDFASTAGERWQTRFATSPRLEALGAGLQQVDSPAYDRQPELLRYLFELRDLDPAEYVGYRCQCAYPMWRTGYRMTFDFGEPG